jgi:hypothetical protein
MAYRRGDLDPDTANRLVAGRLGPDDAPPAYREVAQLLQDARVENGPSIITDDTVIVAMVDAIVAGERARPKRTHVLTRIVTTKAAVATAVIALTATGAAAATGSLPDPAQHGLARAAQHIGVNLPDTANEKARDKTENKKHDTGEQDAPAARSDSGRGGTSGTTDTPANRGDAQNRAPSTTVPGTAPENHGATVSDAAHNADPSGGKGEEVAPVARDNHGADVRADKSAPTGNGNAGGNGAPPANSNAGGNTKP